VSQFQCHSSQYCQITDMQINHTPDEELVFQLAICKNNKYFIYNLTFVPENPTEQQKENKIPRSWKIIDLSMMHCNRAIFLLFQVRPAMSHVCRATQCIRRFLSPSTFLSTLDVMVTSFSNVNNFFFPVFKDKAQYNFPPLSFGRGSYQGIQYCHLSFANGVNAPNGCSRKPVSTFCCRRVVKFMLFYLVYGLVSVKRYEYVAALCLTCREQKLLKLIAGSFSSSPLFAKDRKQICEGRNFNSGNYLFTTDTK